MIEYTLERYRAEQKFVEAVDASHVDVNAYSTDPDAIRIKRDLVKKRYRNLTVEGGVHLPVEECNASRVCEALRDMYTIARRFIAEFAEMRQLIARTNDVLSLEERALREAAKMPLFAQASLDKARTDTAAYFVSLTPEQKRAVKSAFGARVKQYLSNSGRVKAQTM